MIMYAVALIFILIALYGYFSSIKISPLEKDIRKQGIEYECFECKTKFSVNKERCPNCYLITLYGQRKKKYWRIIPIFLFSGFMVAKFFNLGLFT